MENNTQPSPTVMSAESDTSAEVALKIARTQPIPPPSEPRQYRAIGLVRGRYVASEEQATKGTLLTEDGTEIDAVLLGRVISLVKNHLSLEEPHLWVVYPRTRQEEESGLHVQIVGVWEPEKLQAETTPPEPDESESDEAESGEAEEAEPAVMDDGYFSIRGEAVFCSAEKQTVIIKIQQLAKKPHKKGKSFKLHLRGNLPGDRPVGHFWDLRLARQGNELLIEAAEDFGFIPKRRKKFIKKGGSGSYSRKPRRVGASSSRPVPNSASGERSERPGPPRPAIRRASTPRPSKPTKPIRRSQQDPS